MIGRRAILALGAGLAACRPSRATSPKAPAAPRNLVDLTHTLSPEFPFIPVENKTFPFRMSPIATLAEDGVYANRWELTEHVGTHLDAPSHFAESGTGIDGIPLDALVVPLAVVSIEGRAATNADATCEPKDLELWEQRHGPLPPRAAVFLHTGWQARVTQPGRFVNADANGQMHFPGFSIDAVDYLLRRDVAGIGIDTLSIDPGKGRTYPVHKRLFAAGKWAVECLANLERVPPASALVFIAPVKVARASGAPARVIAWW